MPKPLFYVVMILAILCDLLISVALFTTLKSGDQYAILIMVIALFAYSFYRIKAKKVNLSDLERAKAEAEAAAAEDNEAAESNA